LNAANDGTAGSTSGKIIAGATEITGVWKATGASANVAITSAATGATITGGTNSLVAGTGGTITQKANPDSTSVLVVAGADLNLGTTGNLVLGTNATPGEAGSISTGSVKITAGSAGETEIAKIWTATGTGVGAVTIAGGLHGATITKTPAATGLKGGTDGTITQNAVLGNNLILTGVTVDLVTAGSIILKDAASNQGTITLDTTGTVILCAGDDDKNAEGVDTIGGKGATVGSDLAIRSTTSGDKIYSITGAGDNNTIVPSTGESDHVTIDKDSTATTT
jgi:hypothetical protein